MWPFKRKTSIPLEQQLEALAAEGFSLRADRHLSDLLSAWSREDFEKEPYRLLLVALGGETESPPFEPLCDDIWHFDTECIEDHGDYARIARRMSVLSKGVLPLTDIRDSVDVDEGQAWLEFAFDGQAYHLDFNVDDDWVDVAVFHKLMELAISRDSDRRFISGDLHGQDMLIGFANDDARARLQKLTGVRFTWLN